MKKIYYGFIVISAYFLPQYAVLERVRPIQYTALSGRMIYLPAAPVRTEPFMIPSDYYYLPHEPIVDYDEAVERNRRMRLWQYQRASRRRYGSYNYHRGSAAEPPIGITPDTKPLDINGF